MSYHEITISGQQIKLIPLGDCACGCGRKTSIAKQSSTRRGWTRGQPIKFISGHHKGNWKRGYMVDKDGYRMVPCPGHPRIRKGTNYVLEHILRAEKALGKPLPPGVEIHHLNGSRDSGPLVICQDRAYHKLLHLREKTLRACGHATWAKCWICQKWDSPDNIVVSVSISKQRQYRAVYHIACRTTYDRQRRLNKS